MRRHDASQEEQRAVGRARQDARPSLTVRWLGAPNSGTIAAAVDVERQQPSANHLTLVRLDLYHAVGVVKTFERESNVSRVREVSVLETPFSLI